MHPLFADDLDLARRAIAGEPGARDVLAERLRCIGRIVGARQARGGRRLSSEALEDLVQDVATTVWKKLSDYAGDAPLEGWVAAFCHNAWRNASRGESRRALRSQELVEEPATCDVATDELDGPVHRCMGRLVEEDAAIVRSKHFDGLTLDEIARRVQRNLNAIKARYYRALLQLRQCLGGAAVPA
jgi:RNA polymerase sigma-70 factor (ECF subfamily)